MKFLGKGGRRGVVEESGQSELRDTDLPQAGVRDPIAKYRLRL
ncbi:hypothetical protein [Paenibacillus caseinilyticus]|nr:hypothetical protein [Paenibacillus caseinilyticus]MCZ8518474.1 hypothetical protein [Paenibacillus caseinilyticus]